MASEYLSKYKAKASFFSIEELLKNIYQIVNLGYDNFLNNIIRNTKEEIPHEDILEKYNNNFIVFLFNTWKNNLLNISYDDVKNGKYDVSFDIMPLINYLKRIPDAKNKEEVKKFLNPNDYELRIFINKYWRFNKNINESKFVSSSDFTMTDSNLNYDGFIVLNLKKYDLPKFCKLFTQFCFEKNIPFNYKYNDCSNIRDNFIIIFDKKYVDDYMEIIRSIFKKFPNLASRVGKPSSFIKKTSDNIGIENEKYSYFYQYKMEELNKLGVEIKSYITEIGNHFLHNNMKKKIKMENGKISIIDYLSSEIAKTVSIKQITSAKNKRLYNEYLMYQSDKYLKKLTASVRKELLNFDWTQSSEGITIDLGYDSIHIDNGIINNSFENCLKYVYNSYPQLYNYLLNYIKISKNLDFDIDGVPNEKNSAIQFKKQRV